MKKVSQGEETLEPRGYGAEAAPKTTAAFGNSNWADEFIGAEANGATRQPGPTADEDWTAEFTGRQQPDLADQWSREFTGESAEVFRSDAPSTSGGDFWSQLQQDWEKAAEENPSLGWLKETPLSSSTEVLLLLFFYYVVLFQHFVLLCDLQYSFESENPYKDLSDPFNDGLQKKAEGDLPSAILLFEAALQKDPDHMKAWEVLGLSLAENEQDPGAILAYKRCLALEPTNLIAIMGLAVSYTNESYQLQACQALEDWMRNNPKYAHLVASLPPSSGGGMADSDRTFSSLVSG